MSKKIQLTIPKPCHENWDAMTPVEKGKFCGSCQKQVVDFSNMSDRQIAAFFKKPSTGSVCGRFMSDQLERDIEIPKKRIPWVKYFFQILLPAFFVSKASAEKTQGKITVKSARDTVQRPLVNEPVVLGEISTRNITPVCVKPPVSDTVSPVTGFTVPDVQGEVTKNVFIRGTVVDDSGLPLPGATVMIKGTRTGTATEINGSFSLKPPKDWKELTLIISYVGFNIKEITVKRTTYVNSTKIELAPVPMEHMLMGVIVQRFDVNPGKFIPVISDNIRDTVKYFKVFPNPIPTGSNLTIEWKQSEEGYFNLQLLNASGQVTYQQELWIDADARLLNIDLPQVAAGNYFLVLTSKKSGKRFTEQLIIQ